MILSRHYMKEFFRIFAVAGIGLSAVMSALELIRHFDDFMPHSPSALSLLEFGALLFPRYFLYMMPLAALLCVLFTIGQASRAHETVAFMAAGGRLKRLFMPFVTAGIVLSALGFALEESVIPWCSEKARGVENAIMGRADVPSTKGSGALWLRAGDGSLVEIEFYMEEQRSFRGISVFRMGAGGLREIVQAEEAEYLPGEKTWTLRGARIYDLARGAMTEAEELRYPGLTSTAILQEEARKPYELGIFDLRQYLGRLKAAGFKNLRLEVELHSRLSYPLVSFFMTVLGLSIAARRRLGGIAAAAVGLAISLAYWFGYTMMLSLGYAGIVPPFLSAWLIPLAFGALAAYLFARIPE